MSDETVPRTDQNTFEDTPAEATTAEEAPRKARQCMALEAISVTAHTWNVAYAALSNMVLCARDSGASWEDIAQAAFMTTTEVESLFANERWHIVIDEPAIKVLGYLAYLERTSLSEALNLVIRAAICKSGRSQGAPARDGTALGDESVSEPDRGNDSSAESAPGHRDELLTMEAPLKPPSDGEKAEPYTSEEIRRIIGETSIVDRSTDVGSNAADAGECLN